MTVIKTVAFLVSIGVAIVSYQNVVAPLLQQQQSEDLGQLWTAWKSMYGRTYTPAEDQVRFGVFADNYVRVQTHNAKGDTYYMALNQFADLTAEEFKATYASCAGNGDGEDGGAVDCPSAENCPTLPVITPTVSINWTTAGAVTPIKNQEQCGSCWAFSTTGSLEGLYFLNHSILLSFSEQQLVDCASQCFGCDGCWPYLAMEYTAEEGIELEKVYPYTGVQGNCKYTPSLAFSANTGYQCIPQKNFEQMYSALTMQPVSIAVEADQNAWQLYSHGIVSRNCGDALDHAVLIAGYSQSESAWYVKNSWGTTWGMNGYIWISADAKANKANSGYGVCGILSCGNLPLNS